MADDIRPVDLSWTEDGRMAVRWNDGHDSTYTPELLRSICALNAREPTELFRRPLRS